MRNAASIRRNVMCPPALETRARNCTPSALPWPPAAARDSSPGGSSKQKTNAQLPAHWLLNVSADAVIRAEELVGAGEEALIITEIPHVENVCVHLQSTLAGELELTTDPQVQDVERRQFELPLRARRERKANRG